MIKVEYYEVSDNYSEDGRSPYGDKVIGRFTKENSANLYAKGRGNYGSDARVTYRKFYIAIDTNEIHLIQEREKLDAALGKLTEEEKTLLGLKTT